METLPTEKSSSSSSPVKIQSFMSLEQQNMFLDQELDQLPNGVDYGSLDNGLTYYVCCHPEHKMRAALALAVKVISAVEEEEERGVAHMVQHLAFSATKKYTKKDIVKFQRSIGAVSSPCKNNAYTSFDDTVYDLLVPLDKPELLSKAISVLAEFSSEILLSKDDLGNEREAVMLEYGVGQIAHSVKDAHWALMMEGSKFFVTIRYKMQAEQLKTIRHFRDMLVELMFAIALNRRFSKISNRKNSPYFSCSAAPAKLLCLSKAIMMTSYCKEMGTLEALESMLLEDARV
ncbi:hypothetical protein PTKIN_Ptkin03bG0237900 [Pterospermum kingtungense]